MTDLNVLHRRIAALGLHQVASGARVRELLGDGKADALAALVEEVEETRLARFLTFQNDRSERLTLHVASGRVLALVEPTSDEFLKWSPAILGVELGMIDQARKTEIGTILTFLLHDTTQLSVRSSIPTTTVDAANLGIVLDYAFFDAIGSKAIHQNTHSFVNLERFEHELSAFATAIVRIDIDQVTRVDGARPLCDRLFELAKEELSARVTPDTRHSDTAHFVLMSAEDTTDQAAICASMSGSILFATFLAEQTNAVLNLWADCQAVEG